MIETGFMGARISYDLLFGNVNATFKAIGKVTLATTAS